MSAAPDGEPVRTSNLRCVPTVSKVECVSRIVQVHRLHDQRMVCRANQRNVQNLSSNVQTLVISTDAGKVHKNVYSGSLEDFRGPDARALEDSSYERVIQWRVNRATCVAYSSRKYPRR